MKVLKRKRFIYGLVICIFIIAILIALRFFAIVEPQTQPGDFLFRTSYALTSNKESALQGYSANLMKYNGSYIPDSADKFLCAKLQNPTSKQEFNAIVEFYAFREAGRYGVHVFLLSTQTKQRITDLILNKLKSYNPRQATRALVLVEILRQGKFLGKANLFYTGNDAPYYPKYEVWWEEQGLPKAEEMFLKWWHTYPTWQQKEKHNPLANSNFVISAP